VTVRNAVVGLTALTGLVVLAGVGGPLRALAGLSFFLVAPGLGWARRLPLRSPAEVAAATVAVSLALDILVSEILLYLGVLGTEAAFLALAAVALAGALPRPRVAA
jgi:hypothetical protein